MTLSEDTPIALEPGGRPAPRRNPHADRPSRRRLITYVLLVIAVVVTLLPFAWMLLGSLKTDGEILRNPSGFLPQDPTLDNYATWFNDLNISMFFVNSLIVAVFTVLGNLVFCSMIGYALAKIRNSPAPSIRAASISASGIPIMNCRIRKTPSGEVRKGRISAG